MGLQRSTKPAGGSSKKNRPDQDGAAARNAQQWGGGSKVSKGPVTAADRANKQSSAKSLERAMTDTKKKAHDTNLDRDLRGNPGIGQSKGAFAMEGEIGGSLDNLEDLEGINTVEGDVENEANPFGRVTEGKVGRTNR